MRRTSFHGEAKYKGGAMRSRKVLAEIRGKGASSARGAGLERGGPCGNVRAECLKPTRFAAAESIGAAGKRIWRPS
ncbi:MAG: hypothetical protein LBU32_20560 [Clostridiales bacterium]|nr:hypothetical protein [Clostridiales bacterium]